MQRSLVSKSHRQRWVERLCCIEGDFDREDRVCEDGSVPRFVGEVMAPQGRGVDSPRDRSVTETL